MNKFEIEKCLNELQEKNCEYVWFTLDDSHQEGANFIEIKNDIEKEYIRIIQNQNVRSIPYSKIVNIKFIC